MPYLKIQTNQNIVASGEQALLREASALVATELGKPENYVMVNIEPTRPMLFAGTDAPTAYLELKSIGLAESQTKSLSAALCNLINKSLNIPTERIYIEFADATRSMWGWNKSTF
ncbi:hypothetical protein MNBD_GAMMA23-896 [hydrothermal vent metagenome]|uniref:L-dopachrome isomerase n=1 Tax=hydrothermal vent metagenome TaxID=652676 RepID=A0A3B0ZF62_9ZZZZ